MNMDNQVSSNNDRKLKDLFSSSYFWAFIFAAAIAGWMLSGDLIAGGRSNGNAVGEANGEKGAEEASLFKVRAQKFHAKPRQAVLTLRGRTEADAKVLVRAETAGVVEEIPANKGDLVDKGTLLCRIEKGARDATLLEANAAFAQAEADYEASVRLAKRGHTAKLKVAEFQAKRDAAKASIARAELDLERTEIRAPFRGIVEDQPAKAGDFLSIGGACVHLVATDPIIIVGAVSERDIVSLTPNMKASATLITGETVEGRVRFVSPASDANTRTFRVELEAPNHDFKLRDGVTADIRIPLQSTLAHEFTPAILGLGDDGKVGVRIVDGSNKVKFVPITILDHSPAGVWVAGLPEQVTVITVGQDYVVDGQKVDVVLTDVAESS